jgi:hypothetical protein
MPPPNLKANDLSPGMNPPICPTGTNYSRLDPGNTLQCSLDLTLNRPLMSLNLKTVKVRTIVLDFGPALARFNRLKGHSALHSSTKLSLAFSRAQNSARERPRNAPISLHQFQQGHLGSIPLAHAQLKHAGVATRTILKAWRYLFNELVGHVMVVQDGQYLAPGVQGHLLSHLFQGIIFALIRQCNQLVCSLGIVPSG